MKTSNLLAILAVLLGAQTTHAGEAAMKPSPLIARVLGTWKGPVNLKAGGQIVKGSWEMTCVAAAGGFAANCSFSAKGFPGIDSYEGSSILGVDPATRAVHWYWITNGGEVHDHTGAFPKGDTLDVPFKSGGQLVESLTFTFSGKTMKWTSVAYDEKGNETMSCVAEGKK